MKIGIFGTGYLGATHAVCMAELGFEVVGVDVDPHKVACLASGNVPFYEPGLDGLLRANLAKGRLTFTASAAVAADADVHFICVGTPQQADAAAADLRYVDAALSALVEAGPRPGALVVGKSTVPAGTAERLTRRLEREAPGVSLAWSPEFLREGFAVEDTLRPDRLVFGLPDTGWAEAEKTLQAVYARPISDGTPVVVTDLATAELVKSAANAFLATKISFINAMAEICEAVGGDVTTLAHALSFDTRIGGRFLAAGLGFGGGCLPKDIRAFQAHADELGVGPALAFLAEVDRINLRRRARTVELALNAVSRTPQRRVAVLGAAFKPNSDDIRDSPALSVADDLRAAGCDVVVYDPVAMENAARRFPELTYAESALTAVKGANVVLHLTEWAEFGDADPAELGPLVDNRAIIDARNTLDAARWRAAGWSYQALGRPNA